MSQRTLLWLASYPKSGNTWTRAFLHNYLTDAQTPAAINDLDQLTLTDTMLPHYQHVQGGPLDDLSEAEVCALRPQVLAAIAGNGAEVNLVKTHMLCGEVFGVRLIPPQLTRMAVYIVRDPRDLVPSYARHYGQSIDRTIDVIGARGNRTTRDDDHVEIFLESWSMHVSSWVLRPSVPVHVMRYEDMVAEPDVEFRNLLQQIGLPVDDARLARAIEFSSFRELQLQEQAHGFSEQSQHGAAFFHSGSPGAWEKALSTEQATRIETDHGEVMRRFGYL